MGGEQLPIISWTAAPSVESVDFKNSLSGVAVQRQPTFQDVAGTIVVDYDFSNNPFAGSFNLVVGTILTNVYLYLHAATKGSPTTGDPNFHFASILITSAPMSVVVDGKIGLSFNFLGAGLCTSAAPGYSSADGAITYPA